MDNILINHAIMHVLNYDNNMQIYSEKEMQLDNESAYNYIARHLLKLHNDMKQKSVVFEEGSIFKAGLADFLAGRNDFVTFSTDVAYEINSYFEEWAERKSINVLMTAYKLDDVPFLAVLLLDSSHAFTYETKSDNGVVNEIIAHNAVLPSLGSKASTYGIINTSTMQILYQDGMKSADKEIVPIMKDTVLQCTDSKSSAEVVKAVKKITTEVAKEFGENQTMLLSKAKNYIKENAQESEQLSPIRLAEEVFEDHEEMKKAFTAKVKEAELPKEVILPKAAASRVSKSQKIKTDTGIEISFPVEYFDNTEYISFINHEDGTITIELKHIGHISNKE